MLVGMASLIVKVLSAEYSFTQPPIIYRYFCIEEDQIKSKLSEDILEDTNGKKENKEDEQKNKLINLDNIIEKKNLIIYNDNKEKIVEI